MFDVPPQLDAFFAVLSFVFGAMVGSFLNVCIHRWPNDQSIMKPSRSFCPKCENSIAAYDNIPLLSWLLLGGRCRHCQAPISWRYPLVEGLTAVLFVIYYLKFGVSFAAPVYMLLAAGMVVVTFVDLEHWIIPNEVTFPGLPIGIACALLGQVWPESGLVTTSVVDALIGVVLGGGILYLLDKVAVYLLNKPGMGFGDVKLLAMLGAFVGWQGVLFIIMAASMVGSVVGVSVILVMRARCSATAGQPAKAEGPEAQTEASPSAQAGEVDDDEDITLAGHYLPFGPYLAVAGLLYLLFGPELIAWYTGAFAPAPASPVELFVP